MLKIRELEEERRGKEYKHEEDKIIYGIKKHE